MSLWEQVNLMLGAEKIKSLYDQKFPIEVRELCASWIEEQILNGPCIGMNDPNYVQHASDFISNLVQQLDLSKQQLRPGELALKIRIEDAQNTFRQHMQNPESFYKQIRDTLLWEKHFVDSHITNAQTYHVDIEIHEIQEKIKQLREMVKGNAECGNLYKHELEQCMLLKNKRAHHLCHEKEKLDQKIEGSNLQNFNALVSHYRTQMQAEQASMHQKCIELLSAIGITTKLIDELQQIVIQKRLSKWQREQVLAGNGGPYPFNALDEIQQWFEALAEIIWNSRSLVDNMRCRGNFPFNGDDFVHQFEEHYNNINNLLQNLIVSSFIVEKQPPQVMKTNTRFAATVRLLLSNLSIHLNNPVVHVSILSETQAQTQQQNYFTMTTETSGEIFNSCGHLEYQPTTRHLVCNLENMQLKKIKRSEKKNSVNVMDEKFALLFQSKFQIGDLQFNVWVMSVPVVVIVHGNQEIQSWATILWDNAFAEPKRVPFHVSDQATWSSVSETLNLKFFSSTGRGLTEGNLYYLYEKFFGENAPFNPDSVVSRSQFCKETLPYRPFTFWEWFYSFLKLKREDFCGPWADGSIIGFIKKSEAEQMLLQCPPGTFLLRFSDSKPGGIIIAWVEHRVNNVPSIVMLNPFDQKDLTVRTLSDCIRDLGQCVFLYPDIPKDTAFKKYYSRNDCRANGSNGYTDWGLVVRLSGASTSTSESNGTLNYTNHTSHNQYPLNRSPVPPTTEFADSSISTIVEPASVASFGHLDDFTNFNIESPDQPMDGNQTLFDEIDQIFRTS